jgi:hypothetical protein
MSLYGIHRLVFLTEALCSMLVLAFIRPRLSLQLEGMARRVEGGGADLLIPRICCGLFQSGLRYDSFMDPIMRLGSDFGNNCKGASDREAETESSCIV